MENDIIKFSIPSDDDGYISLECPFCGEQFKILVEDFEDEENFQLFCPYCGLVDENNNFLTGDVEEHVEVLVENHFNELIDNHFKQIEKNFKNNSSVSFKFTSDFKPKNPKKLIEPNDLIEQNLKCCNKTIKTTHDKFGIFCPFCGVK